MEYTIKLVATEKKKIYVDPQETEGIFLYPSEIKKEGLKEDAKIEREAFERIRKDYGIRRAKKRAVALVAKKDMTAHELTEKLRKSLNDEISIDAALAFMTDMGYINDMNYARDYISSKKQRKSFAIMKLELRNKGISEVVIETVLNENGEQDIEDLMPLMRKYIRKFDEVDPVARQKIYVHFFRKGYRSDLVKKAFREAMEE